MELFKLYGSLGLNDKEFDSGLQGALGKAQKFGGGLKSAFGVVAKTAGIVTGAISGVVGGVSAMANKTAEYGDKVDKMSQKIGISAEGYQKWDYVLQRAGTSVDNLQVGMKTLSAKAEKGSDAFQKLGISQEKMAKMSQEELFGEVVKGLSKMEQGTERATLASELLGKTGTELGPLLNGGTEAIEEQMKMAEQYGMVLDEKAIGASARFEDSLTTFKSTVDGAKNKLVAEFLPSLSDTLDGLAKVMAGNQDGMKDVEKGINGFVQKMNDVLPQMLELGGKIVMSLAESLINNLPQLLDSGTNLLFKLVDTLLDNLPKILEVGLEIVLKLAEGISEKLPELLPKIVEIILKIVQTLVEHLPEILRAGVQILTKLIEGIINTVPTLVAEVPKIIDKMVAGFNSFDWGSIGMNIILGIKDGVLAFADTLVSAVKDVGQKAVDGAKNLFKIKSPSRLMRDEIGKYIPLGMAMGIDDTADKVSEAMERMGMNAFDTIADFGVKDISMGMNPSFANGGGFVQNLTINSPRELEPSEVARMTKNETRNMILALKGV